MRFLIYFGAHAMDDIPQDQMADVARAAHASCQDAIDAGIYVLAGGILETPADIAHTDGSVTQGGYPDAIGGFTIIDVEDREEALRWATKIAVACRCAQEVREIGFDSELADMLQEAARRNSK